MKEMTLVAQAGVQNVVARRKISSRVVDVAAESKMTGAGSTSKLKRFATFRSQDG